MHLLNVFNRNFVFHSLLLVAFLISLMQEALTQMDEQPGETSERILSRKRRYLIFPKGSSLQLVYDSVLTIPDYNIYVVTGVTVALAWGLPDKPVYLDEDLMEQYENGRLPLLLRKDENATDANGKGEIHVSTTPSTIPTKQTDFTHSNYYHNGSTIFNRFTNYYKYFQQRKPDSYYFGHASMQPSNYYKQKKEYCVNGYCTYKVNRNDFSNQQRLKSSAYPVYPPYSPTFQPAKQNYMDVKTGRESQVNHIKSKTVQTKTTTRTTEGEFQPNIKKLHTVFPAMGKRSIRDESLSFAKKFYLDHHRNSRHKLYEIIEKYLFAKGHNGTECVLKTLCEVGQKQNDNEPGSFLAEIVRAVFSLPPAQLQQTIQKRHIDYDDAHQMTSDCSIKFPLCPDSIWTAGFSIASDATFFNPNIQNS